MDGSDGDIGSHFDTYIDALAGAFGHEDRHEPLQDYCRGLLLPLERKSVEPIAAQVMPGHASAKHQSLLHFVSQGNWSDAAVLARVRELVLPSIERKGAIEAWIVDDTGFPKKGIHSVGVARQYCGRLGKQDNCQIAVTLSVANHAASLPVGYRLYLPQAWAEDRLRRDKVKVPETVRFQTKPAIALDQIRAARAEGITPGIVLADAGYGYDGAFRAGLTLAGLTYVVGVPRNLLVWPPGQEPPRPERKSGRGRPPKRLQHNPEQTPISVEEVAMRAPEAFSKVMWREGSNTALTSRFARFRVRPARGGDRQDLPHPVEWLLVEWPEDEAEPAKYWLSTLPEEIQLTALVDKAKLRWRIERDYEELKSELGLDHYEGRGWRGFHHHATLTIATYGFLILERSAFPPSAAKIRQKPALSARPRPEPATRPTGTPCAQFDRNNP
jgi:SRSO17 transposase